MTIQSHNLINTYIQSIILKSIRRQANLKLTIRVRKKLCQLLCSSTSITNTYGARVFTMIYAKKCITFIMYMPIFQIIVLRQEGLHRIELKNCIPIIPWYFWYVYLIHRSSMNLASFNEPRKMRAAKSLLNLRLIHFFYW